MEVEFYFQGVLNSNYSEYYINLNYYLRIWLHIRKYKKIWGQDGKHGRLYVNWGEFCLEFLNDWVCVLIRNNVDIMKIG